MRHLRLFVAAVAPVLVAAVPAAAQERREIPPPATFGQPARAADAAAVDSLLSRYRRAWSQQDAAALAALHADDTEWINAYARMFRGAEALRHFLEHRLFPAFDSSVSRAEMANLRVISRRYVGDDAVVLHLYTEGDRGAPRNAGEESRRTHMHLVLGRQAERWRVVHTAIMDAR